MERLCIVGLREGGLNPAVDGLLSWHADAKMFAKRRPAVLDFEIDTSFSSYSGSAICVVFMEEFQTLFLVIGAKSNPGFRQEVPYANNCGNLGREEWPQDQFRKSQRFSPFDHRLYGLRE